MRIKKIFIIKSYFWCTTFNTKKKKKKSFWSDIKFIGKFYNNRISSVIDACIRLLLKFIIYKHIYL
ncbi:hypothetical protein PFNF135_00412 [Plasmodium falciparum NF135/5.C10]|uniref:Uncharacterized protein n=1 Tax=Plasmodium falciparum NF135/5.C10 TaxID=1036726 RepID=W4IMZ6_PLAFA|nr:hypothetical protein PFNF135_00412 [Plasmodium falciparum NF135/5.C10]